MVKKKYRALRAIAFVLQVLAWVSLVLTLLSAVLVGGAMSAGFLIPTAFGLNELTNGAGVTAASILAGVVSAVGVLIVGILDFVILLAASEFIYVQIDIEQNTRQTAEYLRQAVQMQPVVAPSAAPTTLAPADAFAPTPTITVPSTPVK